LKTARQVKDLIRNLSRKTGVDPQILFRNSQYSQDEINKIIQTIKSSSELESNWYQYQSRNDFAHELAYSDVCSSLEKLIDML